MNNRSNKRLLAIRPGGIGDCILSFPALESLRARCSYLEVWTPRAVVPLVRFADRVRAITSTGLDLLGVTEPPPSLLETLGQFDSIVSWYGTNRHDFRAATQSFPIEFHPALPPPGSPVHAIDFFSAQLGAPPGAIPKIPIEPRPKRDFIAIHPFSGSPKKNWPLRHFDELALHHRVEWCATPEQSIELGSRSPLLSTDDLAEVAQWLASARLYIGNDSGLTHLAAAVGTPVLALFLASNPGIWAPRGPHVTVLSDPAPQTVTLYSQEFKLL